MIHARAVEGERWILFASTHNRHQPGTVDELRDPGGPSTSEWLIVSGHASINRPYPRLAYIPVEFKLL